jgi:hypothetical protein
MKQSHLSWLIPTQLGEAVSGNKKQYLADLSGPLMALNDSTSEHLCNYGHC